MDNKKDNTQVTHEKEDTRYTVSIEDVIKYRENQYNIALLGTGMFLGIVLLGLWMFM